MRETPEELAELQALIDRTYAAAGPHLAMVHEPERRLTAEGLCERLQDMCLLTLATVSADNRPFTGPVDAFFVHGAFHFSSSPESLKFRHILKRPQVSATHLPGEHLAVTVHGRAELADVSKGSELREIMLAYYVPRYGESWEEILDKGALCARIVPEKLLAFHMDV